jgi:type II secretory pathway component PulM
MIANLSRRERLVVGLAVIAAVVLGAWLYVVEPILEHNRSSADLVPARAQVLQQRRDLIGRQAAINAELDTTMKRFDKLSEGFLTAGTPAVAASELQKIVKDMAAQARTEVRSERILPPADRGELLEIPVEIAVSCEIRQLVDLLARLESAP